MFPIHRFLRTLIFFDLAVVPYLIISLAHVTPTYNLSDIILAFTGWTSLGNSNWFMFAILSLYFFTFVGSLFTKRRISLSTIFVIIALSVGYIFVINHFKNGASYWSDTILCFSGGMIYAHFKKELDYVVKNKFLLGLCFTTVVFAILYIAKNHVEGLPYIFVYNLLAVCFCLLITIATSKVKISNHILQFLGTYGFEIYILQRIPDILLQPYLSQNAIAYFIVSFSATIGISILFKKLANAVTKKLA